MRGVQTGGGGIDRLAPAAAGPGGKNDDAFGCLPSPRDDLSKRRWHSGFIFFSGRSLG